MVIFFAILIIKNKKYFFSFLSELIRDLRVKNEIERAEILKKDSINYTITIKGGRFEVDLIDLVKRPVYWNDNKPSQVQRCLWFYKETNDQRFIPYDEEYSEFLEVNIKMLCGNEAFKR